MICPSCETECGADNEKGIPCYWDALGRLFDALPKFEDDDGSYPDDEEPFT